MSKSKGSREYTHREKDAREVFLYHPGSQEESPFQENSQMGHCSAGLQKDGSVLSYSHVLTHIHKQHVSKRQQAKIKLCGVLFKHVLPR